MNEQKINITDLKKAFEPMEENMKLAIQIYAEEILILCIKYKRRYL